MTGEEIRAYRKENRITQSELANELNDHLGTKSYSKVLISYVENGLVDLPENAEQYLAPKIAHKAVRTSSVASNYEEWGIIPHEEINSPKSEFSEKILDELKYYTKDHPFIAADYADSIGCKEVRVRQAIRELRMNHIRICSDPKHRGYWLEENGGGYEITRKQMLSRAFKLLAVVKAMDNAQDGQLEWAEGLG